MTTSTPPTFPFPPTYSFPPFFTPQPNSATRLAQLQKWSSLIQSWCRHHRIYRLSLVEAVDSPLFHNAALRKRLSLSEVRNVVDWMARGEEDGGGGRRAEWADGASKTLAWIWWRRPEEWAGIVEDWVENTGQKNMVLTVYELLEGEATMSQEWHGMDPDVMLRSLNVIAKRGKAQVFGSEGQEGVKFF
ncbi:ESCRT-II subunit protein VPS25 [Aspergillus candidus]|uniref:Vacuolar protein-sorting-associated protein 25 n=1 Tax=Aspergillus candidus TaxID=41067 RepID=A0A2I2FPF6_ASPCN|nr:ESCRT-II complex subunit-domain-containing protein [Aspergillus candidus]PLB42506.1 ESCRT-II complex subunit-domain-containing protein [Aspergillus candidus]